MIKIGDKVKGIYDNGHKSDMIGVITKIQANPLAYKITYGEESWNWNWFEKVEIVKEN